MNRLPVPFGRRDTLTEVRPAQQAEQRAPQAATKTLSYQTPGIGTVARWSGEDAITWAYYANVYVYACVRALAQDVAGLAIRAGADPDKPTKYNKSAKLAQLLGPPPGYPAPGISVKQFIGWTVTQWLICGRWAWEVDGSYPDIAALWPLTVQKIKPIPTKGGNTWFSGYEYNGQGVLGRQVLRPNQVVYHWRPSQYDWREPESALQAARLDISVAVMQDRYDVAFLRNDARPAAVVVHEAFEDEQQKLAWRAQFLESHQGPDNAGRVAFAQAEDQAPKDAVFIQSLGLSQRDAEFIRRYEAKIRAICVSLGVPLSRLGDSSARTFSNADRETINYWGDTVYNVACEISDGVNARLAPLLGSELAWFDFSKVKALQKPKYTPVEAVALFNAGVITRNEAREQVGEEAVEGGDEPKPPAPAPPSPANAPNPTGGDGGGNGTNGNAPTPANNGAGDQPPPSGQYARPRHVKPKALATRSSPVADEAEAFLLEAQQQERRTNLWHQTDRRVRILERQWERRIQELFDHQRDSVIARLEGKRGRQLARAIEPDPQNAFNRQYWEDATAQLARDLYEMVIATAGMALDQAFSISFDIDAPHAQEYIAGRANRLAGLVTDTTYSDIKAQLTEGAAQGESIPHLADRIRTLFDQTYAKRAETVARTEVVSAYNGSTHQVAMASPQIAGLEWLATRDKRVRKSHLAMDGKIIHKGQAFELDGATMAYPGDPNVQTNVASDGKVPDPGSMIINCRCAIVPLSVAEMAKVLTPAGAGGRVALSAVTDALVGLATGALTYPDASRALVQQAC